MERSSLPENSQSPPREMGARESQLGSLNAAVGETRVFDTGTGGDYWGCWKCDQTHARCLDDDFEDSKEPELLRGKGNDAGGKDLVAKGRD